MKKISIVIIILLSVQLLQAQGMLNKSEDYVLNSVKKDKKASVVEVGQVTGDSFFYGDYMIHYTRIFREKGFYPFQVSYYYYFDPRQDNVCTRYVVTVPHAYFRDMMANLKGFYQIDNSNFKSIDGKTTLMIDQSNEPCSMIFMQDYVNTSNTITPPTTKALTIKSKRYDKTIALQMIKKFGNYNASTASSIWNCNDLAALKLFDLKNATKMNCKVEYADSLINSDGKLLVIIVAINPTDNDCHGCSPLLKFYTCTKNEGKWISSNKMYSRQMGSYGTIPSFKLKKIGDNKAFLFTLGFTGQGETEESLLLLAYYNGAFKEVLNLPYSHDDNLGACDSTQLNSCYSYDGSIEIQPSNKQFKDIIFSKKGTNKLNGVVLKIDSTFTYQFIDGSYVKKSL